MTLEIITDPNPPQKPGDVILSPDTFAAAQKISPLIDCDYSPLHVHMGRGHAWDLYEYLVTDCNVEFNADLARCLLAAATEKLGDQARRSHAKGVDSLLNEFNQDD